MMPQPPDPLIDLLTRLGLATREEVEAAAWRVRRLAGDLPLFESVWVDALCQARVLTPFQAAEINAGRGARLRIGPYLLCRGMASHGMGEWFLARSSESSPSRGTPSNVRLLRASCQDRGADEVLRELHALVADLHAEQCPGLAQPREAGIEGDEFWIACRQVEGHCAADWMAHNGRFPPAAVLEIARQMAAALTILERHKRIHGDLGARQLLLTPQGIVVLPLPGVRAILRPAEGYTRLDLLPEGYDYLAPERIASGTPPDTASELYACGCLWWHLLCGRPPLSGGDALGKLRSAQQGSLPDLRRYAPETPPQLIEAIAACTQLDPRHRPRSMAALAELLGPPEKAGRATVAQALEPQAPRSSVRRRSASPQASGALGSLVPLSAAVVAAVALSIWWLGWGGANLPLAEMRGSSSATAASDASLSPVPPVVDPQTPADLVLDGEVVHLAELRLQAKQTVRSATHRRTLVVTPAHGLPIVAEDVRFVNIDFASADSSTPVAIVQLHAHRASFQGCSFQVPPGGTAAVAVDWTGPPATQRHLLPSGRLEFVDCVFHQLARGIDVRAAGALRLDFSNCLHVGPGAWITLNRMLLPEEGCLVSMVHCTLRGGRAALELASQGAASVGELHLRAEDCAFAPARAGSIVCLLGAPPSETLLQSLRISGQGSIVSPDVAVACWQSDYGAPRALAEDAIPTAGIVRSSIGFAGDNPALSAASRTVRWQAPLISSDPPGILDRPLPLPTLR